MSKQPESTFSERNAPVGQWQPTRMYFGADYNPDQWPRESWPDHIRAMTDLGVNLVTLAVFSWSQIEVDDGRYEFGWLDEVIDLLDKEGVRLDLATATASPPAWLFAKDPSIAAIRPDGVAYQHGGRQHHSPSSSTYRRKSLELVDELTRRYADHPALEMWHVNNELGGHVSQCYGNEAAVAFRGWLIERYTDINSLNDAWHTTFWSQSYSTFDQVNPPRITPPGTSANPAQILDFQRFSSDQLLHQFIAERDAIRHRDSKHPVTTNFMAMRHISQMNYWQWAREVDFVSTDHYAEADNPRDWIELAFQADLTRGLARGKPWLLMEHSPSAVNWQPRNRPKDSAETLRHSMSHIARGSNGAMFFQFVQSRGGSERFHSAMVPHTGSDTRIYQTMKQLGHDIKVLSALNDTTVSCAGIALVFDYESWWSLQQTSLPSADIDYFATVLAWYTALHNQGFRVDIVPADPGDGDWQRYRLVLLPLLHVVSDATAQRIDDYVKQGGHIATSYFSGVSTPSLEVRLGGYGGSLLGETCGVFVEEFVPLQEGERITLESQAQASLWAERALSAGAVTIDRYTEPPIVQGQLAISRHQRGDGLAWYVGTDLGHHSLAELLKRVASDARVFPDGGSEGVEVITRDSATFVINHSNEHTAWQGHTVKPGQVQVFMNQSPVL